MSQITNDHEFRQAIQTLDPVQQRIIAAGFVKHVFPLSNDERIEHVIKITLKPEASETELSDALKTAMAATMDSYARCGAEGSWSEQAAYFVARAAVAAVTAVSQSKAGGPAWQAAMSSRMAQTSISIDEKSNEEQTLSEQEWQYKTLSDYLES